MFGLFWHSLALLFALADIDGSKTIRCSRQRCKHVLLNTAEHYLLCFVTIGWLRFEKRETLRPKKQIWFNPVSWCCSRKKKGLATWSAEVGGDMRLFCSICSVAGRAFSFTLRPSRRLLHSNAGLSMGVFVAGDLESQEPRAHAFHILPRSVTHKRNSDSASSGQVFSG